MKPDDLAKAQVDAFMRVIEERFDLDEKRVKNLAQRASTNGKVYITYSVVVAVLLAALGFFITHEFSRAESRFQLIESRQDDVRERLKAIEARAMENRR